MPLLTSVMVTFAPATTAPVGSVTVPKTPPNVAWLKSEVAENRISTQSTTSPLRRDMEASWLKPCRYIYESLRPCQLVNTGKRAGTCPRHGPSDPRTPRTLGPL